MKDHTLDLSRLERCRLLVVGDLMLDEYVWGAVERISPEAPVQVVAVSHEDAALGGAGNVVSNLAALGARVAAVGVVGNDAQGRLLVKRLKELGADTGGVLQVRNRVTTRKARIIAEHQQVLRIDHESTRNVSARVSKDLLARASRHIAQVDMVVLSDYGKGLLTRPLIAALAATARGLGKKVVADPKGIDYSKYNGVSVITPNTKEASLAAGIDIRNEQDLKKAAERLLESLSIEGVLITRGKDGMAYFERGRPAIFAGTKARQVFDVSGAGDTVVAVLSLALAAGHPMPSAIGLANAAAGVVVSKVGTATVSRAELQEALSPSHDPSVLKAKSLPELSRIAANLKAAGKRIVLTNGCFDLLHAGHIRLFGASRAFGDVLIVALDDDRSVRSLKGAGRPVISAAERVKILSAIDSIDYVTVFSTRNLRKLIQAVKPDVLAKGSNYESEQVAGRDIVERMGGRVALIPVADDLSSTTIIKGIKGGRS